jgi:hypothetical protein
MHLLIVLPLLAADPVVAPWHFEAQRADKRVDVQESKNRAFVSNGPAYKSVEGVLDRANWAPDKGSDVVALTLKRDSDGEYWTYFFPYQEDAVLVNGIVQAGTTSSALVNLRPGVAVKLYLDPAQGDACKGVEVRGHVPTFNYLMRQAPIKPIAQPTYSPPMTYFMPAPMMMGGFGGGCSGGG